MTQNMTYNPFNHSLRVFLQSKNIWYCNTLKDYIYMLEKQLHYSLKEIKKLEEGFDKRNKLLKLEYVKK